MKSYTFAFLLSVAWSLVIAALTGTVVQTHLHNLFPSDIYISGIPSTEKELAILAGQRLSLPDQEHLLHKEPEH